MKPNLDSKYSTTLENGIRARGQIQDFYKLREECPANGTLSEDPEFSPEDFPLLQHNTEQKFGMEEAREMPRASSESQDSIITTVLSILCGVVCRDTPLAQAFETKREGFSKDICRSMVAMMDVDRSGKLGYEEFKALWTDIRHWKTVFKMYDKDNSGYLSAFELRQALNSAGYRLNNHILNILVHRYGTKDGMISFDDFMMCTVKLKAMIDMFKERDPDNTNTATFTMEEWIAVHIVEA